MSWWWLGIVVVVAAIVAIVGGVRRGRAASIAEELFEGLLPSAVTGGARGQDSVPGWGARWTEDLAHRPVRDRPASVRSQGRPVAADAAPPGKSGPVGAPPAFAGATAEPEHALAETATSSTDS